MDTKNRMNKLLQDLAEAATIAADEVTDAVQNAGQAVSDKYDLLRLKVEIARLSDEQENLFAQMGRCLYNLQTLKAEPTEQQNIEAQKTLTALVLQADQKQLEIDGITARLNALNGSKVCPACNHVAEATVSFCPSCGQKLPTL